MWRDVLGYSALTRRSLRRGHDPLRRRADRVEGLLAASLLLLLVAMVPLAVWLGNLTGDRQSARAEQQARDYRQVTATTMEDATSESIPSDGVSVTIDTAPARWIAAGQSHRGEVTVDANTLAGSEVTIWVDADGNLASAPISAADAAAGAVLVGLFTWTFTAAVGSATFAGARALLNRRRQRQWSADILAFLGSATSH